MANKKMPPPPPLDIRHLLLLLARLNKPDALVALSSDEEGNSHNLIDPRFAFELCTIDGQDAIVLIPSGKSVELDLTAEDLQEIAATDAEVEHLDGQGQEA